MSKTVENPASPENTASVQSPLVIGIGASAGGL